VERTKRESSECLTSDVGISDTGSMRNNAVAAYESHSQELAVVAPGEVAGGAVYDTLGMPMSLVAAKLMTEATILAALGRTLAKLHHEPPESTNASANIDSIEVVFLVNRFFRDLDRKQPDLSKIDRDSWSNLEGIAEVLHGAMEELK
jgi:hypothetical protein